jgi:hypothetical protein
VLAWWEYSTELIALAAWRVIVHATYPHDQHTVLAAGEGSRAVGTARGRKAVPISRQRSMILRWRLKVLATSVTDLPSSISA